MGMFDTIKVEQILPGETEIHNDLEYQTKDLKCVMTSYVISAEGELYEEQWKHEWIEDSSAFFGGYIKQIEGSYYREYLTDFHGDIRFYSSKPLSEDRIWRDYYARFTDGKLTKMWYKDEQY